MVIYLIWSQEVTTWPTFPLISHNDLQTSISNMASSNDDTAVVCNANPQQQVRVKTNLGGSCF